MLLNCSDRHEDPEKEPKIYEFIEYGGPGRSKNPICILAHAVQRYARVQSTPLDHSRHMDACLAGSVTKLSLPSYRQLAMRLNPGPPRCESTPGPSSQAGLLKGFQ